MIRVAAVVVAAAVLAACGGALPAAQPSRISADAAQRDALLYVSDAGTFEVHVYDFPSLEPAGTLTGFTRPEGMCTDARGNVWIANTISLEIFEYAHGGTSRIGDLSDPTGYPASCAIDPTTGNLAVTNIFDLSGGGGVIVFKGARGTPRPYSNHTQRYCYFAAYDAKGDLYVSGSTAAGSYVLTALRKGGSALSRVTVSGAKIGAPGAVVWDGSTLILGDQKCGGANRSCLYKATVSGETAKVVGKIPLDGSCDVAQVWIGKGVIAGGDSGQPCAARRGSADLWPYPAGGSPTKKIVGLAAPVGATVSFK